MNMMLQPLLLQAGAFTGDAYDSQHRRSFEIMIKIASGLGWVKQGLFTAPECMQLVCVNFTYRSFA